MGKTTTVAKDRAYDPTKTVLPAEIARGVYVSHPPSLMALKLMHLMIGKASGRMAEEVEHSVRLSDIRAVEGMKNHTRVSLTPLFQELRAAVLTHEDTDKKRLIIGGLVDEAQIDFSEESAGDLVVSWWFSRTFRRMADNSDHWAILDRQTIFHLSSRYSVLLFQHIASLTNLAHVTSKSFTIPEIRAMLGIADGKIPRFANLRKDVLEPVIAEISQLSRFQLSFTLKKLGRTVIAVEIHWSEKPPDEKKVAKKELAQPKTGRKARRDGTVEQITTDEPVKKISFPKSGGLKYERHWYSIAEKHAQRIQGGHLPDTNGLASAFRDWCQSKGISLDAKNIETVFVGFCKSYRPLMS